jgi:hypothetical protein
MTISYNIFIISHPNPSTDIKERGDDIAHIMSILSGSSVISARRELELRVEGSAMLAADMLN